MTPRERALIFAALILTAAILLGWAAVTTWRLLRREGRHAAGYFDRYEDDDPGWVREVREQPAASYGWGPDPDATAVVPPPWAQDPARMVLPRTMPPLEPLPAPEPPAARILPEAFDPFADSAVSRARKSPESPAAGPDIHEPPAPAMVPEETSGQSVVVARHETAGAGPAAWTPAAYALAAVDKTYPHLLAVVMAEEWLQSPLPSGDCDPDWSGIIPRVVIPGDVIRSDPLPRRARPAVTA